MLKEGSDVEVRLLLDVEGAGVACDASKGGCDASVGAPRTCESERRSECVLWRMRAEAMLKK